MVGISGGKKTIGKKADKNNPDGKKRMRGKEFPCFRYQTDLMVDVYARRGVFWPCSSDYPLLQRDIITKNATYQVTNEAYHVVY